MLLCLQFTKAITMAYNNTTGILSHSETRSELQLALKLILNTYHTNRSSVTLTFLPTLWLITGPTSLSYE